MHILVTGGAGFIGSHTLIELYKAGHTALVVDNLYNSNPEALRRVAQIIAVADTFDAMYSNRPYRKRMNFEKAVSIIKEVRGTQLQDDVVDAFLRLVDKGKFRAPDDFGGGTTEDINNIHKKQKEEEKKNDGK